MAIKNIKTRKLRSWLTMIGIFIGILSIVSLIGLGEGLRTAVSNQFGAFAPDIITISTGSNKGPPGSGGATLFPKSCVDKIERLKEIKSVAARNIKFGKIEFEKGVSFRAIASLPDGNARELVKYGMNLEIKEGRFLKDGETGKIFVGSKLAKDEIFGKDIVVGSNVLVNNNKFEVIGILKSQGNFMIDGAVFMNEKDHYNIFDSRKDEYSFIVAQYDSSLYSVNEVKNSISKLLRRERNVKEENEDFEIKTPQSIIENLNSTLFAVQLFVYIIAGISILVGGIGIMSTMYTTVLERTKEVGIMKSIGARNKTIFILFFIESGFIGLAGGVIGVLLGSGLSYGLAFIGKLVLGSNLIQANISFSLIMGALLFSFLLGSIFGTFPALRAAKMNPVEALSYVK